MKKIIFFIMLMIIIISSIYNASAFNWTTGLIAYWSGDYGNATTVKEDVFKKANFTLYNGANRSTVQYKINSSINFDGVDDYGQKDFRYPNISSDFSSGWSVSLWYYLSSTTLSDNVFFETYGSDTAYIEQQVYLDWESGKLSAYYHNKSDNTGYTAVAQDTAFLSSDTGVWHHVVATHNNVNLRIYVDGSLKNYTPVSGYRTDTLKGINIGRTSQTDHNKYPGYLDEVGFWNRTLNDSEVSELYNGGSGLTYGSTGGNGTGGSNGTSYGLGSCTVINTPIIIGLALRDENTQEVISVSNNLTVELEINISSKNYSNLSLSYKGSFSNASINICLTPLNQTWNMNLTVRYYTDNHANEFYHVENYEIKNTSSSIPLNINLYDLKKEKSTEFLISYKDKYYLSVTGALIDITRNYLSEGVFKTVEISKTGTDGKTLGHFELDGPKYTINVYKSGSLLSTHTNIVPFCESGICQFNLQQTSGTISPQDFTYIDGVYYLLNWTSSTRTLRLYFTTSDGSSKTIILNTTKIDRFNNQTVCSNSSTGSSGTLYCVVPSSYGNSTVIANIYSNGNIIGRGYFTVGFDSAAAFGNDRYLFFLVLLLIIPLMFITSLVGILIGLALTVVLASLLFMISGGSMIGTSAVSIWLLIAIIIVIIKIVRKEND